MSTFGALLARVDAGWSATGEARRRGEHEYGVLKISAVTSGWFRPDEHKAVSQDAVDRELVTPCKGDLLFSRANRRELVAATCLVEDDYPSLFLPDKLWRLVPKTSVATTTYLRFVLAQDGLRSALTKTATGTSGSMLNFSMAKLRALPIPVPTIDAQRRFDRFVWDTLQLRTKQLAASASADALFSSLLQASFRGDLKSGTRPRTTDSRDKQVPLFENRP